MRISHSCYVENGVPKMDQDENLNDEQRASNPETIRQHQLKHKEKTIDHLESIRKRPAMYIGKRSLSALYMFLNGYEFAMLTHKVKAKPFLKVPQAFHDWVAYRLHFDYSTSGWCNMILDRTKDEEKALDLFWNFFDEFNNRKPKIVARLTGINKSYTSISEGIIEEKQYPESISLVTYTDDPGFFVLSDDEQEWPGLDFFPDINSFESETGAPRTKLKVLDENCNYGLIPEVD